MLFHEMQPYFDFVLAGPEIVLLILTLVILLIRLFDRKALFDTFQLTILALSIFGTILILQWKSRIFGIAFSGLFIVDEIAYLLKVSCCISLVVALYYGRFSELERTTKKDEFYLLALFSLLGQNIAISAGNLVSIYLGLELTSLSLYALIAYHKENPTSLEAAIKYFLLGGLASGFLLYGMSMIYGITGQLDINKISFFLKEITNPNTDLVLILGVVFIISGLAFKLSIAPFHMWTPDIYQGTHAAVAIILSAVSKYAPFAILFRLFRTIIENIHIRSLSPAILLLCYFSLAIGALTAIVQKDFKRMLGYSSISHMGFILLGLLSAIVSTDSKISEHAYAASLFYLLIYVLSILVSFGLILFLSRKNYEFQKIDDFKGLNQYNSTLALLMLISMFSFAGIPPTAGFYSKVEIFRALIQSEQFVATMITIFFSLIGSFYCLRVIKTIFFEKPEPNIPLDFQIIKPHFQKFLCLNGILIILIGLFPSNLMNICIHAVQQSFGNKLGF